MTVFYDPQLLKVDFVFSSQKITIGLYVHYLDFATSKKVAIGAGEMAAPKSTYCSFRGPMLGSQHPCPLSQPPVTPSPGGSDPLRHLNTCACRHSLIHIIKIIKIFK